MILSEPYGTTAYIMGWVETVFFGLGLVIGVLMLFDKRVKLRINSNGIWSSSSKQDKIKWEDLVLAYPLEIQEQSYIAIKTTDTFVLKTKLNKWTKKLNTLVGAEKINISINHIDADSNELIELINKLQKIDKKERLSIIQAYNYNQKVSNKSTKPSFLLYIIISLTLLFITFNTPNAFMIIIGIMGITAIIARWYQGSTNAPKWVKYARIITILGFVNMILLFITFKSYDYVSSNVADKIIISLKNYKKENQKYPSSLNTIKKNLELNSIENYFFNKMSYSPSLKDYKLKSRKPFNKEQDYNTELGK